MVIAVSAIIATRCAEKLKAKEKFTYTVDLHEERPIVITMAYSQLPPYADSHGTANAMQGALLFA